MASESDSAGISSSSERQSEQGDILVIAVFAADRETLENPGQELPDLFIRPVLVISQVLDALLGGVEPGKQGRPPAAKSAVKAMPRVLIGEKEKEDGGGCVICLEDWSEGEKVAEMPCKHRFHVKCIEEWLGRHGTCPVCRYEMPVEDQEEEEAEEEERGHGEERGFWFRFSIYGGGRRRREDGERR